MASGHCKTSAPAWDLTQKMNGRVEVAKVYIAKSDADANGEQMKTRIQGSTIKTFKDGKVSDYNVEEIFNDNVSNI